MESRPHPPNPPTTPQPDQLRTDPDRLPLDPSISPSEGTGVTGDAIEVSESADDITGEASANYDAASVAHAQGLPTEDDSDEDNRAVTPSEGTGISGSAHDPDIP
jgi:hypothetical protein